MRLCENISKKLVLYRIVLFQKKNKNSFITILVRMNKNVIKYVQTILNAYKRKNMLHNSIFFDIIRCIEMKEKT